jgi:hypothetical protein
MVTYGQYRNCVQCREIQACNLAWFLLGEAGLLLAGSGLVVEFALFQRRRHLKLKAERLAHQQLAEHALVESTRFNVTDRGK